MHPQLQDGEHPTAGLALQLREGVEIPGIDHNWLLADGVRSVSQGQANVSIMEVIRAANAHPVDTTGRIPPPQLIEMAVEAFNLAEVADVLAVSIQDADRVVGIHGSDEPVARVMDRLKVPWRDVPADP